MRVGLTCLVVTLLAATASASFPWPVLPDWQSTENGYFGTGCDLADVDGDGFLDLAVSNGNDMLQAPNLVYLSQAGELPNTATWVSDDAEFSGMCGFADLDADGYPELMVANYITPGWGAGWVQVYANDGGTLATSPTWESPHTIHTFRATFGDPDGDGDLDLAVATGEEYHSYLEPTLIFFNEGGTLQASPGWASDDTDASYDIAFVDIDGDGDQDLAVLEGSAQGRVKVYFNEDGVLATSPGWVSAHPGSGNSFDFGDLDGDGDLDLVVHYNDQLGGDGSAAVYRNEGGTLATTPDWSSDFDGYGSAVACLDVSGDAGLDLVAGSWWGAVRLYVNVDGTFPVAPDWQTDPGHTSVVESFAFADLDESHTRLATATFATGVGPHLALPHLRVQRVVDVSVGGVPLPRTDWCCHAADGWVSVRHDLLTAPITVTYAWSPVPDLVVANWDDATYIFRNQRATGVPLASGSTPGVLGAVAAYPNPFNPTTTLTFELAQPAPVRAQVFDIVGHCVATLVSGPQTAGRHALAWQPQGLASGVYLYRVQAGTQVRTGRVLLAK